MAEKVKKLKFPMDFDKCPVCGSHRRVVDEVKKEEIAKGKIRPEKKAALTKMGVAVTDAVKIKGVLTVPLVTAMVDICADCGALYAVQVDRTEEDPGKFAVIQQTPVMPTAGKLKIPFMGQG